MANHACIAIGINQYQFFQPLNYAEADARALRQFLVESAGLQPDRCLLLTDTSPPMGDMLTYPNYDNLRDWIEAWCQEVLQPGDLLWFFFSGYGVSTQEEDYLMPMDGNPSDIADTGIPMRWLFKNLKAHGAENVLVLMDINRSQGVIDGATVGQQTVELASELGIATVLSCQSDQFSHASSALGHGLFTATLLEALRHEPEMTLASLEQYMSDRLPELSEHHWQPLQTPLIIYRTQASQQRILPTAVRTKDIYSTETPSDATTSPLTQQPNELEAGGKGSGTYMGTAGQKVTPISVAPAPAVTGTEVASQQGALVPYQAGQSTEKPLQTPWWRQLLLVGGGTLLVLGMIAGVLIKVFHDLQTTETLASEASTTSPATVITKIGQANQERTATPVGAAVVAVPNAAKASSSELVEANTATLDKAKSMIPNQVSGFSQAIAEAQKIKQSDPLYEKAKADIVRWSRVILDLAEARAQQEKFSEAIAAAQLVPPDQPVYAESQQAIARWKEQSQQQRANTIILQAAKGLISSGQASSYNRAITVATKVSPEQPGYGEAKVLIDQWSKNIYQIAQERASRGEYKDAIATATLIPKDTGSYEAAQKAIGVWEVKTKK